MHTRLKKGDRIRLVSMPQDPDPIPVGSLGTVVAVHDHRDWAQVDVDWDSGRSRMFDFGPDHVLDEMVHVPKPGATAEDDAWLVGPSINLREGVSELHVLDMARVEDGPVATWRGDVALPAGFHGVWRG